MKLIVEFNEDAIGIHDEDENEIVYWTKDEWIDDPEIVFSIVNAVKLAYTEPNVLIEKLKCVGK